ncbi:ankyrin repeat domain-containing protein [Actinoplanes sp. CA-054009]
MSDLANWARIRRYAVPAWMIAECTAARERGDWRAACAAADVVVGFDAPDGVEDLLAGFAPDLLRWHLPRALGGYTTLGTEVSYVLSGTSRVKAKTLVLVVRAPVSVLGSQQLTLTVAKYGSLDPDEVVRLAPYHWDARHAAELRAAVGGSASRLPRFDERGSALPLPALGRGDDDVARLERVMLGAAEFSPSTWAEAGVEVTVQDQGSTPFDLSSLARLNPFLLAAEARRVSALFKARSWAIWFEHYALAQVDVDGDDVRVTAISVDWRSSRADLDRLPRLSAQLLSLSVDLDLVWHGRMPVAALHPLVRAALFPGAEPGPDQAPAPAEPLRVHCQGEWHEVGHDNGRLILTRHTAAEEQRERALLAFGGAVSGCFAVSQSWSGAAGRLPRRLRAIREDLWQRIIHGGTRAVLDMLDGGLDPHLRNGRGQTLMHVVRSFDHTRLLPRLLAEGADINARDRQGNTPLYLAITQDWPVGLIRALVAAGADPHAPNHDETTVIEYLEQMLEYMEYRSKKFRAVAKEILKRA